MNKKQKEFIDYVKSFYFNDDAPYPFEVPLKTLIDTCIFISKSPHFLGDSTDREYVRICLKNAGYKEKDRCDLTEYRMIITEERIYRKDVTIKAENEREAFKKGEDLRLSLKEFDDYDVIDSGIVIIGEK